MMISGQQIQIFSSTNSHIDIFIVVYLKAYYRLSELNFIFHIKSCQYSISELYNIYSVYYVADYGKKAYLSK
jgi:hypothetical protein